MILSRRWRFIFIKGQKVAGTSVELALSEIAGPDDIVTPITPIDERGRLDKGFGARNFGLSSSEEADYLEWVRSAPPEELGATGMLRPAFHNHMPLRTVLELCPEAESFAIWGAERSPYAKVLSWIGWQQAKKGYVRGEGSAASPDEVRIRVDEAMASGRFVSVRNIDKYKDAAGVLRARLLRHERLAKDFEAMTRGLGVAPAPALPHAKRGLQADQLDPREVFRTEHIAAINEAFAEEFEAFGYDKLAP